MASLNFFLSYDHLMECSVHIAEHHKNNRIKEFHSEILRKNKSDGPLLYPESFSQNRCFSHKIVRLRKSSFVGRFKKYFVLSLKITGGHNKWPRFSILVYHRWICFIKKQNILHDASLKSSTIQSLFYIFTLTVSNRQIFVWPIFDGANKIIILARQEFLFPISSLNEWWRLTLSHRILLALPFHIH